MSYLTGKQIDVAVEWWAKLLDKTPSFTEQGNNAKLEDSTSRLLFMIDLMTADKDKKPEGDIEKFKTALREILFDGDHITHIDVDYNPCRELYQALKVAGFNADSMNLLPWKTSMSFYDGEVQAKKGYGSAWEVLYTPEK